MDFCVYDDCTWLYPDRPLAGPRAVRLDAPGAATPPFSCCWTKTGSAASSLSGRPPAGRRCIFPALYRWG